MFGASRSVAGSLLINLRRQKAEQKAKEQSNPYPASNVKQYVIPNFALFEFLTANEQQDNNPQVSIKLLSDTLFVIRFFGV